MILRVGVAAYRVAHAAISSALQGARVLDVELAPRHTLSTRGVSDRDDLDEFVESLEVVGFRVQSGRLPATAVAAMNRSAALPLRGLGPALLTAAKALP